MPSDAALAARDAGLRRVTWLTRGVMTAGVALTGLFAAIAAHAFPGRSGPRAIAVPPPADAVALPAAETTTEPPTTIPSTTVAARSPAGVIRRPLQPPATVPRPVVPARPVVAPAPAVKRVRPHVVTGGS